MSSSEDEVKFKPSDNLETVEVNAVPLKSKENYEAAYQNFMTWKESEEQRTNEDGLLAYFESLTKKYKPTTLWAQYSMLKCTINIKEKVDIGKFSSVTSYLKDNSRGFQSKKTNIFTAKNIQDFVIKAPDEIYLATKVAVIIGIAGACRSDELVCLKTKDIEEHGKLLLVRIPKTKFKKGRSFTITEFYSGKVKQYRDLRPKRTETDRFFLNFQKGKCTVQVIGKNKFSSMPKQIATYLQLPDPSSYTGHAFRRTAAILQKDAGSNILDSIIIEEGDKKSTSVKFEEVLLPIDNSDEEYELVPMKRPKVEMDSDLKDGNDPLEKMS